jgi:adenosylhomocysteinase
MRKMPQVNYDIHDIGLADAGLARIKWAYREMPVLQLLNNRFKKEQPLKHIRVGGCLHITTETANLACLLKAAGAEVTLCASNPLSTQDDVAAALVQYYEIPVHAIRGEDDETYYRHINAVLDNRPNITLDDGCDLVSEIHKNRPELIEDVIGGCEETTTGVIRLRSMANEGALKYPMMTVNDAMTKHLFDNRYGTGQSALDGIIRATNILLAGKIFTVVGYGWCGRGIAMRAKGLGAIVNVTEVDPLRALEAAMDGFRVLPLSEAAAISDFIISATGDKNVIDKQHLEVMKDGCVLSNSGHFNVEINLPALEEMTIEKHQARPNVEEYKLADGRILCLLAEGRLVNLVAAEGHPSSVMDMSFSVQALSVNYLVKNAQKLEAALYEVPEEIDQEVAMLKLSSMGIMIDTLTDEQQRYLASWQEGT